MMFLACGSAFYDVRKNRKLVRAALGQCQTDLVTPRTFAVPGGGLLPGAIMGLNQTDG